MVAKKLLNEIPTHNDPPTPGSWVHDIGKIPNPFCKWTFKHRKSHFQIVKYFFRTVLIEEK